MENKRFVRTEALIGAKGMNNIKNSTVMIIGLGAVGGYALEAMARVGVGHLVLVDFDSFDETNINRQILATMASVGRKKTDVALERVKQINPDCIVDIVDCFVDEDNIENLLSYKPDYIIDAIDSIKQKCKLIRAMVEGNINFISSMGAALRIDASAIKITTLNQTQNCSMARTIRQNLKKQGTDLKKVKCVFSDEQSNLLSTAIQPNENGGKQILGSLPTITAIFGFMMANYVMQQLIIKE